MLVHPTCAARSSSKGLSLRVRLDDQDCGRPWTFNYPCSALEQEPANIRVVVSNGKAVEPLAYSAPQTSSHHEFH